MTPEEDLAKFARVERACVVMHDAYEAAAKVAGWDTNEASRRRWADVPQSNKATMRFAVSALLAHLAEEDGDPGLFEMLEAARDERDAAHRTIKQMRRDYLDALPS